MLTGDRTRTGVRVTHGEAEGPLPQPRTDERRFAVARPVLCGSLDVPVETRSLCASEAVSEDPSTLIA